MRTTASLYPGQRFYIVCILLILFGAGIHLDDMRRVAFGVHDDRVADLEASQVKAGGVHEYLERAEVYAKGQARIGFFSTYGLFIGPWFWDEPVRSVLISAVHFLTFLLIALFVWVCLGIREALLTLLGLICFLPHPGGHFVGDVSPIVLHLPVALVFLGYFVHRWFESTPLAGWQRLVVAVFVFFCTIIAACGYEALYLAMLTLESARLYYLYREANPLPADRSRTIQSILRLDAPIIAGLITFGLAYVSFRAAYPTTYEGTQSSFHFADTGLAIEALVAYVVSALPGADWFFGRGSMLTSDASAAGAGGWFALFRRQIGWEEAILGVGVGLAVWWYVMAFNSDPEGGGESEGRWAPTLKRLAPGQSGPLRLALVALAMAFVTQIPIVLTPRYREHFKAWAPYAPSFFAFIGICIAGPALLNALLRSSRVRRGLVAALCAGSAAVVCLANREASGLVLAEEQRSYSATRMMDRFIRSKTFAAIPEQAVILAPNLWDDISPGWGSYPNYWAEYVKAHSGRHVQVVRVLPALTQIPHVPGQMFYLEKQSDGLDGPAVFLLSDLFIADTAGPAALRARSLTAISEARLTVPGLMFEQAPDGLTTDVLDVPVVGFLESAPLSSTYDGSAFVSRMDVPDKFIPGTAYLMSSSASTSANKLSAFHRALYEPMRDTQSSGGLQMEFSNAFSELETGGNHKWHWSNGKSGTGDITIWNRSFRPIKAELAMSIHTGYPEPSRLELQFQGKTEALTFEEKLNPIVRVFTFAPGRNQLVIHSSARRLNTSALDPRYIVFGVYDWQLTPVK